MNVEELLLIIKSELDKDSQAKVDSAIKKNEDKLKNFGKKTQKTLGQTQKAGNAMVQSLMSTIPNMGGLFSALSVDSLKFLGIVGAITVAVKGLMLATREYMDFEQSAKGVQMVMLSSPEERAELERSARKDAKGSLFDATEASKAQKYLAQAGLNQEQIIGALPEVLNLATATGMDLSKASDIATDIMSAQGLAVSDLTMINDELVSGANHATLSAEQLGQSMGLVGVEARNSGISVKLLSASLGVLASSSSAMKASGGTYFRNLLVELKTSKVREAGKKVGIDMHKFVNYETGKIKDLVGLVQSIAKLNEKSANTLYTKGFAKSSRGVRALKSMVVQSDKLAKNFAVDATGLSAKASSYAFKGLTGETKQSKSRLSETGISLIKDTNFWPIMADTVDVLATAVEAIGEFLKPLIKLFSIGFSPMLKILKFLMKFVSLLFKLVGGFYMRVLEPLSILMTPLLNTMERMSAGLEVFADNWNPFGNAGVDGELSLWDEAMKLTMDDFHKYISPFLEILDIFINAFFYGNEDAKALFKDIIGEMWDSTLKVFKIALDNFIDMLSEMIKEALSWENIKNFITGGGNDQDKLVWADIKMPKTNLNPATNNNKVANVNVGDVHIHTNSDASSTTDNNISGLMGNVLSSYGLGGF